MSERLRRFEKLVADALLAPDPVATLRAAGDLGPELNRALACADADGVRLTALLVARLRFERLVNGSREAGEWFARDPRGFSEAFRRYHESVPPTAADPRAEAELFAAHTEPE